jgi:hypothetical protein
MHMANTCISFPSVFGTLDFPIVITTSMALDLKETSATIANYGHAYSGYEFYKSILLHILAKGKYTPKGIVSTRG